MKRIFVCAVLVMVMLVGCVPPTATPQLPTVTPSVEPPTVTPVPPPSATPTSTATATATRPPSPLITPTPPTSPIATPQVFRPAAVAASGLRNWSFEAPFIPDSIYTSIVLAQYWHYWYLPLPPCKVGEASCNIPCPSNCNGCPYNDVGCFWAKPEWSQSYGLDTGYFRVDSLQSSQKIFVYAREGEGGMYQVVNQNIRAGDVITFGLRAMAWQCFNFPACFIHYDPKHGNYTVISDQPYAMNLRVGIDPTGGTDPLAASVRWSTTVESFDHFSSVMVSIVAPAASDKLTVFFGFGVRFDYARPNNDIYVDSAFLLIENSLRNKTFLPAVRCP